MAMPNACFPAYGRSDSSSVLLPLPGLDRFLASAENVNDQGLRLRHQA